MYDATNEPHEFVGAGRDEAVAKASRFFGVESDALTIKEFPAGDVYGTAARTVIVAYPKGYQPSPGGGGGGDSRGQREDRPRSRDRDRGGRGGGGGGRDRGGRERGGRDRGDRGGRRSEQSEQPVRAVAASPELSSEPSVGTAQGELGEIGRFLLGAIERMNLGPFTVSENSDDDLLVCQIAGAAAAALTTGDGRAVDALQLLANQVSMQLDDEPRRVVVDVEGDAESRETLLADLAQRVARHARDKGRAVALDPMNGRDRRMVHVALRDESDIATMSVGEGRYRQVVVVPEGAPDFEKAKRDSEAAARADS